MPRLSDDDRLLLPALRTRGVHAEPVIWDDPDATWQRWDGVVVRSCWDYHLKLDAFDAWTRRLESLGVALWNPPPLLRWNARKSYLRELAAHGIPVVPTRFVEGPEAPGLEALLADAGWGDVVVKPVVSASAHETWRARRGSPEDAARFRVLLRRAPVMIQPFLRGIQDEGEWSLCFFGGEYSHAVLKRPRPGDFRVQEDHGGVYRAAAPDPAVVSQAAAALEAAGAPTVYARVDGCVLDGVLQLMELELLEPGLFLRTAGAAADRFAGAIVQALGQE